jgi:hypothetical protein
MNYEEGNRKYYILLGQLHGHEKCIQNFYFKMRKDHVGGLRTDKTVTILKGIL